MSTEDPSVYCWRTAPFSIFPDAIDVQPVRSTTLPELIDSIRTGAFAGPVAQYRAGTLPKTGLPTAAFSGTFTSRRTTALKAHSGLLALDIDAKDNPARAADLPDPASFLWKGLMGDPHVLALFVSVSGAGLKIIVRVDVFGDPGCPLSALKGRHRRCALAAQEYFRLQHGLIVDKACFDVPRLCFLSDDRNAWITGNGAPEPFEPGPDPPPVELLPSTSSTGVDAALLDDPLVVDEIASVLAAIAPRPDYTTWVRILSGVFNHRQLSPAKAAELLNAWSAEEEEREYERKYPHRLMEIGFPTVVSIAVSHGFDNSKEARAPRLIGLLPELETGGPTEAEIARNARIAGASSTLPDLLARFAPGGNPDCGPHGGPESAPGAEPPTGAVALPAPNVWVPDPDLLWPSEVDENNPNFLSSSDFLEDLLTEGGMSVIYGPSNVGKSFYAMDIAAAIAANRAWRNGEARVKGGAVLYFLLEGSRHSAMARLIALKKEKLVSSTDPLAFCFAPINLLSETGLGAKLICERIARVQERGQRVRLVVVDTLSRAMAGGDENKGVDMMGAIQTLDMVRRQSGGFTHVDIVHHCGKDEARGARGHTSLRAATDTEIELIREGPVQSVQAGAPGEPPQGDDVEGSASRGDRNPADYDRKPSSQAARSGLEPLRPDGRPVITAWVTKQRDLEPRAPMPFRLKKVVVGINPTWGNKEVTSCVLQHLLPEKAGGGTGQKGAGRDPQPGGGGGGKRQENRSREAAAKAREVLGLLPQPSMQAWLDAAKGRGISRPTFYRIVAQKEDSWTADENGAVDLIGIS